MSQDEFLFQIKRKFRKSELFKISAALLHWSTCSLGKRNLSEKNSFKTVKKICTK